MDGALFNLSPFPEESSGLTEKELDVFKQRDMHRMLQIQDAHHPEETRHIVKALIETESISPERIVRSVFSSVRKAIGQSSKKHPIIVAVHFLESIIDWGDFKLHESNYFQLAEKLLDNSLTLPGSFSPQINWISIPGSWWDLSVIYFIPERLPAGFPIKTVFGNEPT